MQFSLPCEVFARMNNAALQPGEMIKPTTRPVLRSVLIEHVAGNKYAVACTGHILACQLIGPVPKGEPADGRVAIINDPELVAKATVEAPFKSDLKVQVATGWTAVATSFDYLYPNHASPVDQYPDWRAMINKTRQATSKSTGVVSFTPMIARLAAAAPSGEFTLPETMDATAPIVVSDIEVNEWFGVFLLRRDTAMTFKSAKYPEWFQ